MLVWIEKNYLDIEITTLTANERVLWLYKIYSLYESKLNNKENLLKMLTGIQLIKLLDNQGIFGEKELNILLSLEDNIIYDINNLNKDIVL